MKKLLLILLLMAIPTIGYALGTTSGNGSGTSNATLPLQRPTTTVGSLPACTTAGRGTMYVVTDSLLPVALATVGAGGSVVVGVMCNGVNWIVN